MVLRYRHEMVDERQRVRNRTCRFILWNNRERTHHQALCNENAAAIKLSLTNLC